MPCWQEVDYHTFRFTWITEGPQASHKPKTRYAVQPQSSGKLDVAMTTLGPNCTKRSCLINLVLLILALGSSKEAISSY